jgi:hypothetical protein
LEFEFQINYNMSGQFSFDGVDFFEFIWRYERLATQKQQEKEAEGGGSQKTIPLQNRMMQGEDRG